MASPENLAQDVIACQVCGMPTQFFCNTCELNLCQDCVHEHKSNFQSLCHNIKVAECHLHFVKQCGVHSENCTKQLYSECYSPGRRKTNNDEEQIEAHKRKMKKIKEETQKIKAICIPHYQKADVNIESKIRNIKADFIYFGNEREKSRQIWHQEVDDIFDRIDCLSRYHRKNQLDALFTSQKSIRNSISEMAKTVILNEKILKTNEVSEVKNYKSKLKKYRSIPEQTGIRIPSFQTFVAKGEKLRIEMGDFRATLSQASPLITSNTEGACTLTPISRRYLLNAHLFTSIQSNYHALFRVTCVGEDKAWILGNSNVISKINIHGSVTEKVIIPCLFFPDDISVNTEGDLVYSDFDRKTVNTVRNGRIKSQITPRHGWEPHSLCCTKAGGIFIHLMEKSLSTKSAKNKIIHYQGQRITQIIDKDDLGNSILGDGTCSIYITQSCNGDICVSDTNAEKVIILDKLDRVRYRYDGKQANLRKLFSPKGLVTDSLCQIIVSDYNNECVHILSKNGQILRCLDECGLLKPCALSLDGQGRLWVGMRSSGDIKVIEYLKDAEK